MPIYEYRCGNCGFQKDYLQKLSDAPLTRCPACGEKKLSKLVSAAGFQLKGKGWYATDFKSAGKKPAEKKTEAKTDAKSESKTEGKSETKTETKTETKAEPKPKAAATH